MEDTTAFDLDAAVVRWRDEMRAWPGLRSENLDELESHLRDSVHALGSCALTLEEAFLIARRRLGEPHVLDGEFRKVDARRIWADRAIWMVSGWLGIQWLIALANGVGVATAAGATVMALRPSVLAQVTVIAQVGTLLGVAFLLWRLATRAAGLTHRACLWFRLHPYLAPVCLATFLLLAGLAAVLVEAGVLRYRSIEPGAVMEVIIWRSAVNRLLWPAALIWLLWRTRSRAATQPV